MGSIQLAYSTFGLTDMAFADALTAIHHAGYAGAEIACHRRQFNVFELDDEALRAVRRHAERLGVVPACIATASHFFEPQRPHEPSLLAVEPAARARRVELIRRGIHAARLLGAPLVTFGSGFLRAEHVEHAGFDPGEALVESIGQCLAGIGDQEDITLLIEPEPGMYVETLADGRALVAAVGSPKFKLHIDLCHAYCSETDYVAALAAAAPDARYLHVSDARPGHNLRIVQEANAQVALQRTGVVLVHFPQSSSFVLLDPDSPVVFRAGALSAGEQRRIDRLLATAGAEDAPEVVDYAALPTAHSVFDEEIFTWLISNPGLSYDVLERARPVARWLRSTSHPARITRTLANTRTGIAHYHEIPGEGSLDFAASFAALVAGGFSGYAAVELYHHVACGEQAMAASHRQLQPILDRVNRHSAALA